MRLLHHHSLPSNGRALCCAHASAYISITIGVDDPCGSSQSESSRCKSFARQRSCASVHGGSISTVDLAAGSGSDREQRNLAQHARSSIVPWRSGSSETPCFKRKTRDTSASLALSSSKPGKSVSMVKMRGLAGAPAQGRPAPVEGTVFGNRGRKRGRSYVCDGWGDALCGQPVPARVA